MQAVVHTLVAALDQLDQRVNQLTDLPAMPAMVQARTKQVVRKALVLQLGRLQDTRTHKDLKANQVNLMKATWRKNQLTPLTTNVKSKSKKYVWASVGVKNKSSTVKKQKHNDYSTSEGRPLPRGLSVKNKEINHERTLYSR